MYIKDLMDKPFLWHNIQKKLSYSRLEFSIFNLDKVFKEPSCVKTINNIKIIHFQRENYIYNYEKQDGRTTYDNLIIILHNDNLITLYCGNSDKSNYSYFKIGDILYIITKSSVEVVDCINTINGMIVDCESIHKF